MKLFFAFLLGALGIMLVLAGATGSVQQLFASVFGKSATDTSGWAGVGSGSGGNWSGDGGFGSSGSGGSFAVQPGPATAAGSASSAVVPGSTTTTTRPRTTPALPVPPSRRQGAAI